jgi:hypothetical protein
MNIPRSFAPFRCLILLLVLAAGMPAAPAFAGEEQQDFSAMPWALRDHYVISFSEKQAEFLYGSDNAQWSIEFEGDGEFVDKAGASLTLADGTEVSLTEFGRGKSDREKFTTAMGPGNHFSADLPAKDGIKVRHRISVHREYPFLIIRMELTNQREEPLEIREMSPVIFGPGCLKNVSGGMESVIRRVDMRGGYALFDPDAKSSLAFFHDAGSERTIALGVLPLNVARCGINLQPYEGSWQGEIASVFDPPLKLAPGETVSADPVFITFSVPKPEEVETYFTWTQSNLKRPGTTPDAPRSWCTVDEDGGASDLYRTAEKWAEAGVLHALVPAAWESRPGSLEGARPRYPQNMGSVASTLAGMKIKPGITVDPLAATEGAEAYAASMGGQTWLNLSHPEGRAGAVANMRRLAGWGFKFFVVQESLIPDEVLKAFDMTRVQADALALEVMAEAAGDLPVFPSAAATLKADLDTWLEAAACTSRLWEYQIAAGPVRFDASGVRDVSQDVRTVMTFYGGPIEVVGTPHRDLVGQVAGMKHRIAQPIDVMQRAPRTWRVAEEDTTTGEKTVMTFPKSSQ